MERIPHRGLVADATGYAGRHVARKLVLLAAATRRDHDARILREGLSGQELGDPAVFGSGA